MNRGEVSNEIKIKNLKKRIKELEDFIEKNGKLRFYGDGYYKVVAKTPYSKNYFSMVAYGESRVDYSIDSWVSAPKWLYDSGHHLMCFNIIHEAKMFAISNGGYLFKCEIEERVNLPHFCSSEKLCEGIIERVPLINYQKGTIAVKRLKLIGEEINYRLP